MQFRLNHAVPRSCASVFTAVGLRRVSIGPPIRIIDCGLCGSPFSSISATAVSNGTDGWQTPIEWTRRWPSLLRAANISIRY